MARTAITVTTDTAARLRAAMLDLSSDAGDVLTLDRAINFLLDTWMQWRELDEPLVAGVMTADQYRQLVAELAERFAERAATIGLAEWQQAMLDVAQRHRGAQTPGEAITDGR